MIASPASNWFAPPKVSHRAHQLPETAKPHGMARPTTLDTCLLPRTRKRPSPQVSPAARRKNRVTSAGPVVAEMVRTRATNVMRTGTGTLHRKGDVSLPDPRADAPA